MDGTLADQDDIPEDLSEVSSQSIGGSFDVVSNHSEEWENIPSSAAAGRVGSDQQRNIDICEDDINLNYEITSNGSSRSRRSAVSETNQSDSEIKTSIKVIDNGHKFLEDRILTLESSIVDVLEEEKKTKTRVLGYREHSEIVEGYLSELYSKLASVVDLDETLSRRSSSITADSSEEVEATPSTLICTGSEIVLTPDMVLGDHSSMSLTRIKRLTLTGLNICDISLLCNMPALEVVGLDKNLISGLFDFRYCKNMRELYLRHNRISDLLETQQICLLKNLNILRLEGNPCTHHPLYRDFIVKTFSSLNQLDDEVISEYERTFCLKLNADALDWEFGAHSHCSNVEFGNANDCSSGGPNLRLRRIDSCTSQSPHLSTFQKLKRNLRKYREKKKYSQNPCNVSTGMPKHIASLKVQIPPNLTQKETGLLLSASNLVNSMGESGLKCLKTLIEQRLCCANDSKVSDIRL